MRDSTKRLLQAELIERMQTAEVLRQKASQARSLAEKEEAAVKQNEALIQDLWADLGRPNPVVANDGDNLYFFVS